VNGRSDLEVPRIGAGRIHQVDHRTIGRHLNAVVEAAAGTARQVCRAATIGIKSLNGKRVAGAGAVAATGGMGRLSGFPDASPKAFRVNVTTEEPTPHPPWPYSANCHLPARLDLTMSGTVELFTATPA
jgi:hypothetical protein